MVSTPFLIDSGAGASLPRRVSPSRMRMLAFKSRKKAPASEDVMPADGTFVAAHCNERRYRPIPFERQLADARNRVVHSHLTSGSRALESVVSANARNLRVNAFPCEAYRPEGCAPRYSKALRSHSRSFAATRHEPTPVCYGPREARYAVIATMSSWLSLATTACIRATMDPLR